MSAPNFAVDPVPDPAALGDEIARTAAHLDAATHRLLTCIRSFDASGEWHRQGALSCAHWLAWRVGLDPGTAREKVRVARALGGLSLIDDCLRRGELSYAKVRALTRVATPENESTLVEVARFCTGAQLERFCRRLRRVVAVTEDGEHLDDRRFVKSEPLDTGPVRITAVLHADEADVVMKAIEHARRTTAVASAGVSAETPGAVIPMADALVEVARRYGTTSADGGPAKAMAAPAEIVVHLEPDVLGTDGTLAATLDDGTRLSAETWRRLGCDGRVVAAHRSAEGSLLVGRGARVVSAGLRRALWARDGGCRFPGCSNRLFVHAHHIDHWAHGGATTADNLALLCSTHHRMVHEGGFTVQRTEGGGLVFTNRHGLSVAAAPASAHVEGDGFAAIEGLNAEAGLAIEPNTGMPGWDGDPVDYDWALDVVIREGCGATDASGYPLAPAGHEAA